MTASDALPCPCGSGQPEASCCGPLLAGAPAPTALALMRSRYTAYVRGRVDYIVATHHPATRDDVDEGATARWASETTWQGLEIVHTERGGPDDDEGIVQFVARGVTSGRAFTHPERSTFRRVDGRWFFADGRAPDKVPVVAAPTTGRNELCPCGSGKKFKRCHG